VEERMKFSEGDLVVGLLVALLLQIANTLMKLMVVCLKVFVTSKKIRLN